MNGKSYYILLSLLGLIFLAALSLYPGAKYSYFLFSLSFLALLYAGVSRQKSYAYIFLSCFMWLGFWLKASIHFIFSYPYLEPTGLFDFSPSSWDLVLNVSSVAAVALLFPLIISKLALKRWKARSASDAAEGHSPGVEASRLRWAAVLLLLLIQAGLNSALGIQQVGLYPRTVLPWPGNALVAWVVNIGGAMLLAVMAYRDVLAGRSLLPAFIVISLVATAFSVSMLSRGPFIYQALPLLLAAASLRWQTLGKSKMKLGTAAACLGLLFAFSIFLVNSYRTRIYAGSVPASTAAQAPAAERGGILHALTQNRHLRQVSGLFVDRWIGLEGVMAVAAYPEKAPSLLKSALTGRRTLEKTAEFERISGSDFQNLDTEKHQFARLPGPVALFYYSGSWWMVLGGLFALGLVVLGLEAAVWYLTRNPLLCALVGMMAANNAAQLSEAPMQLLPTYVLTFVALLAIRAVRSFSIAPATAINQAGGR